MDHAVVIGASIAGLLSAAALHRRFAQVTVLDRDTLPAVDAHRRGAGQSRHAHGLLARGSEVMDELLPGLSAELVAQGAIRGDMQDRARHVHAGGGWPAVPAGSRGCSSAVRCSKARCGAGSGRCPACGCWPSGPSPGCWPGRAGSRGCGSPRAS
ncbi:NAD(P)-binding protein [Nonomuraea thailandensis]